MNLIKEFRQAFEAFKEHRRVQKEINKMEKMSAEERSEYLRKKLILSPEDQTELGEYFRTRGELPTPIYPFLSE